MRDCSVGVLGIGNMGKGIAASYLRGGHDTAVFDVDPAAMRQAATLEAELAASPEDLGSHCALISIVLRGEEQLEEAAYGPGGLLASIRPGTVLVLHSNMPLATSRRLAEHAGERGARFLEATMTGGISAAAAGALTLMLAGDPALAEECWPKLRSIARRRIFMGPVGAAGLCKAIQDTLFGLHHQTTHEMLQLALAAGVDADRLFEALCAKGWLLERWNEYWTPEGRETIGRSLTTPRMPLASFTPWLWELADELGVDVSSSRETTVRSLAILERNPPGA